MAHSQLHKQSKYRQLHIVRTETLGHGVYGTVYRARCDLLPCAAKIVSSTAQVSRSSSSKHLQFDFSHFERECEILLQIRHPNIVQYLAISRDRSTGHPVLYMELMHESLTQFVRQQTNSIRLHVEVNILFDIIQALAHLHSLGIIHHALTGQNVLLSPFQQAKLTDFGFSKLLNSASSSTTTSSFSSSSSSFSSSSSSSSSSAPFLPHATTPSTCVYLPPEIFQDLPIISEKMDCFSFGVVAVQLLTCRFPSPTPRLEAKEDSWRNMLEKVKSSRDFVPERHRRKSHIDRIAQNHPFLPVIVECLKDRAEERPSAKIICSRLAVLKDHPLFRQSLQSIESPGNSKVAELQKLLEEREKELKILRGNLEPTRDVNSTDGANLRDAPTIITALREELQSTEERLATVEADLAMRQELNEAQSLEIRAKDAELENKESQFQRVKQERLELSVNVQQLQKELSTLQKTKTQLESQLAVKEDEIRRINSHGSNGISQSSQAKSLRMIWKNKTDAPVAGKSGSATALGALVCMRMAGDSAIHICDTTTQEWFEAPTCPLDACSLVAVKNTLTVAGGRLGSSVTNMLFSLHVKSFHAYKKQPWKENFPPMPTKRMFAMAVSSANILAIVGGWSGQQPVHAVEVLRLDHEPLTWLKAVGLPTAIYSASACILRGKIFVMGGFTQKGPTRSVFWASVHSLLDSQREGSVWYRSVSLPVYRSSCVAINDHLLSLGGENDTLKNEQQKTAEIRENETGSVFEFNSGEQEWDLVSQMPVACCQSCTVAISSRSEVVVVGGHTATSGRTSTVQIALLQ